MITTRQVRDIANTYKRRGYEVAFGPAPQELNGYQPDLIARKGDDTVVVEVKAIGSVEPQHWRDLAAQVEDIPGWRLEIITLDPAEARSYPEMSVEEREKLLDEGKLLASSAHTEAALLLTWGVLEALMRSLGDKYDVELSDSGSGTLITRLYSDGLMEREDYDALLTLLAKRNAVAHGRQTEVTQADFQKLTEVAERLSQE